VVQAHALQKSQGTEEELHGHNVGNGGVRKKRQEDYDMKKATMVIEQARQRKGERRMRGKGIRLQKKAHRQGRRGNKEPPEKASPDVES